MQTKFLQYATSSTVQPQQPNMSVPAAIPRKQYQFSDLTLPPSKTYQFVYVLILYWKEDRENAETAENLENVLSLPYKYSVRRAPIDREGDAEEKVRGEVDKLLEKPKGSDLFIIYYMGHGSEISECCWWGE